MAARIASHPWHATELGRRDQWPSALRHALQICLGIRFPALIQWGPQRRLLFNDAYAELIGPAHADLLGRPAAQLWQAHRPVEPIDADRVLVDGASTLVERGEWLIEHGVGSDSRWYTWSENPLYDDDGTIGGLLCICIDETARVRSEEARRMLAEERQLAIDAAGFGWFHYDPQADLIRWDRRVAAIYRLDGDSGPMQRLIERIHPDDRPEVQAMLESVLDGRRQPPHVAEFRLRFDDGSERWITAHGIAEFDADNRPIRLVGTISDDTDRKRAELELRRARQRLELAQSAGRVGTYEFDVDAGFVVGSEQFYRQFGLPADSARMTVEQWQQRLHPDDRGVLFDRIRAALASGDAIAGDYRVVLPDGTVCWLEYSGVLERDAGGRICRVIGTVIDVTARRAIEQSLRASNQRLQLALDGGQLGDWRWCRDTDRISLSERAATILGTLPRREIDCSDLQARLAEPHRARVVAAFADAVAWNRDFSVEFELQRGDGTAWLSLLGRCETDQQQRPVGIIGVVADATRQHVEAEQLQRGAWRQQLLVELIDRIRPLGDAGAILVEVCRLVGERMGVAHCCYAEFDRSAERFRLLGSYADPAAAQEGDPIAALGQWLVRHARRGRAVAIDDTAAHRSLASKTAACQALGSRALLFVPLIKSGQLAAVFSLHCREPHRWSDVERSLAQDIAERSWTLVERVRAEQEVRRLLDAEREARARAEQQSRLKDEFLATLSHELRTPLNAILGWVHLLGLGELTPEQQQEGQRAIERNARAQARLVDDLLDMSRIISGRMRLEPQRIDLCDVIDAALTTVRTAADGKQIELVRDVPDGFDCHASVDPARIQQVLWNLLSNAIKFTPPGGRVTTTLRGDAEHIRITVSDTGEGMRADFLPLLFGRFRQADASSTRRHGGLGIGLALVRQLVELHGGTVQATSEGENHGSHFTVELPRRATCAVSLPAASRPDEQPGEPVASLAGQPLDGVRVLIVEDDPDTRGLLTALLEGLNADVVAAASAVDGLDAISQAPPSVVVSDIAMPECDGYEFMRRLRARSVAEGGQVPAIALTAFAGQADVARAIEAGYQQHLAKPVDPRKLVQAIGRLAGHPAA